MFKEWSFAVKHRAVIFPLFFFLVGVWGIMGVFGRLGRVDGLPGAEAKGEQSE